MPKRLGKYRNLVIIASLFAGFTAILLAIGWHIAHPAGPWDALAKSNPQLRASRHSPILLIDPVSKRQAFVHSDDAGPFAAALVDCNDFDATNPPAWFRMPPLSRRETCVRLQNGDGETHALNLLTTLEIPDLWEKFYAPLVEAAGLTAHGGTSSGSPGELGSDYLMKWGSADYASGPNGPAKRIGRWMDYFIDPPGGGPPLTTVHARSTGEIEP
jgi:hypothetical protein